MEFHGTFILGLAIPWNSMEFGVGIKFHGTFKVPWNSMELPFWHGKVPWNSMELLASSMEFHGNIDINKFHNWGSVFQGFLYDFMSLFIRQSISSWNNEIFQFQSNFLVPLILVKWRYSILNGGLFYPFPNFNVTTVQVWEWISDFAHTFLDMWLSMPGLKLSRVSKLELENGLLDKKNKQTWHNITNITWQNVFFFGPSQRRWAHRLRKGHPWVLQCINRYCTMKCQTFGSVEAGWRIYASVD